MPSTAVNSRYRHQRRNIQKDYNTMNDRLNQLPDDILISIVSYLTTDEAARASLVSQIWKGLWQHSPILNLEDCKAEERIESARVDSQASFKNVILRERMAFVTRVNHVLEHHHRSTLDEFKVTFDMGNMYQSIIDKWLVFAFSKHVKRLEFDFTQFESNDYLYALPLECCMPSTFSHIKPPLTSLILKMIDVTTEVIDYFLLNFPYLEKLCLDGSPSVTSIRASESQPIPLKHLEIDSCKNLLTIDIYAPRLLAFIYCGPSIVLNFRNATSLPKISLMPWENVYYAFDSLSTYFPKLEHLCLELKVSIKKYNLTMLVLTNLKHLELQFFPTCGQSLLQWICLVEKCPVLKKLTLQLEILNGSPKRKIVKQHGRTLKCLKSLEIIGFAGFPVDMEFITHVLEHASMLQEVIADPHCSEGYLPNNGALKRIKDLERIIPEGVKFISKSPQKKKKKERKTRKDSAFACLYTN